jgi:tetratricopeptide (TPR) repeat protein
MTHRVYKAIALGCFAIAALAVPSAHAANAIFDNGIKRAQAQACYEAAEFGGDTDDGIAACTRALQGADLDTDDKAKTFVNRGLLEARKDLLQAALDDYNEGLRLGPSIGEGYVDRGAAEIVLKQYDRALADINHGMTLHLNKPQIAYYDRAVIDEANGDIRGAYQDYKMALQLAPDFTLAGEQLTRFKVVRKSTSNGV